jgi:sorting nexin-4
MLGDDAEDIFDSVTWESPADNGCAAANPSVPPRPGFKQSIDEGEENRGPHDPKWYGYLITQVKDPVKELAETKDAYVSYLVTAKVGFNLPVLLVSVLIWSDEPIYLLNPEPLLPETLPRLCFSQK